MPRPALAAVAALAALVAVVVPLRAAAQGEAPDVGVAAAQELGAPAAAAPAPAGAEAPAASGTGTGGRAALVAVPPRTRDARIGSRATAGTEPEVLPVRVVVERLGVDAEVVPVGVQPSGEMEVPADLDQAGWYRFGPAPGEDGSAVLAGHVDGDGRLGQLRALRDAVPGDRVVVTGSDGSTAELEVVSREQEPKASAPLQRWFATDGTSRVVLLTCGGAFDRAQGSYADNVAVTAVPVGLA